MKTIINATLIATKWGYAIHFEGRLAFLEYAGNVRDFQLGKEYECEIFYRIIFLRIKKVIDKTTKEEREVKDWIIIDAEDLEHFQRNPDFKEFNLKISNSYPNFYIKNNKANS